MIQPTPSLSVDVVGEIVRNAVAPVFLLSGIGAFLNVCASRLSRIVDRSRAVEPRLLESRGHEHDRWIRELRLLDRRMSLVSWATFLSVLSAMLICLLSNLGLQNRPRLVPADVVFDGLFGGHGEGDRCEPLGRPV